MTLKSKKKNPETNTCDCTLDQNLGVLSGDEIYHTRGVSYVHILFTCHIREICHR